MPNLMVKGNVESILNFRDFCELVRREMGDDCAEYLEECGFDSQTKSAIRRRFDELESVIHSFNREVELRTERMRVLLNEK